MSAAGRFLIGSPGALCGVAFTAGILAGIDSRPVAWGSLVVAGTALSAVLLHLRRSRSPDAGDGLGASARAACFRRLVAAVIFFFLGATRYRWALESREALSPPKPGSPVSVLGTVVRPPLEAIDDGDGASALTSTSLELECRDWPRAIRILAPMPLSGVRGGDTIRVIGDVTRPLASRSRDGIGGTLSLTVHAPLRESVAPAPFDGQYWARAVGRMRQHLYDTVRAVYPAPTRGYLLSVLFGDRRLLPPRLKEALLYSGTYHFLAISGLHLGLIMFVVLRVPIPERLRLSARLLFLAGFAVLTGANPPVLRAAVLFGLGLLSARSSRYPRPVNTLGWTALLLLAWEPDSLLDVGFQLSFVAVFALSVLHSRLRGPQDRELLLQREIRRVERRLRRKRQGEEVTFRRMGAGDLARWTRSTLSVSVTAFLGTSPLILHHFHRVHLLSPLWNLVAYPFTFATLMGGAVSVGLASVHPDLAAPVARPVEVLVDWMTELLERASTVPGSTLHLPAPGVPTLLLSYAFLACWVAIPGRSSRLLAGLLILALASGWILVPAGDPVVWTFDPARGGASLIAGHHSGALLVDAYPSADPDHGAHSLASAILSAGRRRLRVVALPPPGHARAETVTALRDRVRVDEVWISPQFRSFPAGRGTVDRLAAAGVPWRVMSRGSYVVDVSNAELAIETLYPLGGDRLLERARARDASLVMRLTRAGRHVLFTGGLGDAGIARLLSSPEDVRADVLVFPRGGPERRLYAELLGAVSPRDVILIGRGGPRDHELARRIERQNARVLATWRRGTVVTAWTAGRGWVARYAAE